MTPQEFKAEVMAAKDAYDNYKSSKISEVIPKILFLVKDCIENGRTHLNLYPGEDIEEGISSQIVSFLNEAGLEAQMEQSQRGESWIRVDF